MTSEHQHPRIEQTINLCGSQLTEIAARGYAEDGRGFIYLPSEDTAGWAKITDSAANPGLTKLVEAYDPEREFVVVTPCDAGGSNRVHALLLRVVREGSDDHMEYLINGTGAFTEGRDL